MLARRSAFAAVAAALCVPPPGPAHAQKAESSAMRVTWGPFKDLTPDEMDRLGEVSKQPDAGKLLPSGIRVINLVVGDGPQPQLGDRIYAYVSLFFPLLASRTARVVLLTQTSSPDRCPPPQSLQGVGQRLSRRQGGRHLLPG
jgi:hypothetical protein